jgi:CO/xanthine dehydrogenase Mo-binding subunit
MAEQTRTDVAEVDVPVERVRFDFAGVDRREFLGALGAGLLIAVIGRSAQAQETGGRRGGGGRGRGGGAPQKIGSRVHVGKDGIVTVMTGKVECGQGARAEITQAAAEELRLPIDRVRLVMADTSLVPDDGITAGSGTTPRTIPRVREGCAAARDLLVAFAARQWNVDASKLSVRDGQVMHPGGGGKTLGYADLAAADDAAAMFDKGAPAGVSVTPVAEWRVMGATAARPNGRELVTGGHQYPSDVVRPGMLYGKVLRAPAYGAKLVSVDLGPTKGMQDVVAVRDGSFVGVAAPTTWAAELALDAVEKTAKWETSPQPSSKTLFAYLREKARGGVPKNAFADEVAKAAKSLRQTYHVAYVQHAPMEPRVAVAEWGVDGKLTVWTATQNPFGVRGELVRSFRLSDDRARVIVPDFGGGFGGKHSGECAVEAARLAQAAGKPVRLRWTRQEEFTWAYFRPAGVLDAEASLDDKGMITSWHFVNINSGPSSIETPYHVGMAKSLYVQSEPPLRHGSYRGLAATANTFARECFMDELAGLAGQDPLAFRLAHLSQEEPAKSPQARLRAVLEEAVRRFGWADRAGKREPNVGVGLACGTEKGSYVATCAEVAVDRENGKVTVRRIVQVFECGAVINPDNLTAQNLGSIAMALGPALREEIRFEDGKILTDAFSDYAVPRFADVPAVEVHLLDRKDLPSAGAGETPLISVAPAIANAVYQVTGARVREMPMKLPKSA